MFTKNFLTSNFKSTLYQAKLLAKVIEISMEHEKICCKEKKAVIFSVNSYHILIASFLL